MLVIISKALFRTMLFDGAHVVLMTLQNKHNMSIAVDALY